MEVPKYVFIDLDNTLYSYNDAHFPAQKDLIEFLASQLRISLENTAKGLELSRKTVKERLGTVAGSHSRLLYISEFLNMQGVPSRPALVLSAEQVYWKTFFMNMNLFPGVQDFLTLLRLKKSTIVLVTDLSSAVQYRKISWLGLDNYFDLIVTSEEAGGDKVTGLPEELISNLIGERSFAGWSIGDQDWDYLFKDTTSFFRIFTVQDNSKNRKYTFEELVGILSEAI
jgi:putative hydrolase of the HAD superfamily